MPRNLLTSILLVELTAAALVATAIAADMPPGWLTIGRALLLTALGVAGTELVRHAERVRVRTAIPHAVDLTSVWIFAGALILPGSVTWAVVVVIHLHMWVRTGRPRVPFYRHLFTSATMVLACLAAAAIATAVQTKLSFAGFDLLAVALALLVFTTVNTALVAGAIAMSSPQPSLSTMVGQWDDNLLEIATLCLGALAAVALTLNPVLILFVFPPLVVLDRSVRVRHLQDAANLDGKTGLLNASAWHRMAEDELRRSESHLVPPGLLIIDVDHFKQVNDTHGHLVGDQVLSAIAEAVQAEVRDGDLVGRFGGEEFVVLLSGLDTAATEELSLVAERIRQAVSELTLEVSTPDGPLSVNGLSISLGGAVASRRESSLHELLQIADTALYAAKRGGRNQVRMGEWESSTVAPPVVPAPTSQPD